jgi:glyoxylase-like metal-dependent hydrolase (beta-lactamase superfamily II)
MALARVETLEWVGMWNGEGGSEEVLSFVDPLGARVSLYFDARTHLLSRLETVRDHAVLGDTTSDTLFSDYRTVGKLRLPFVYRHRTGALLVRRLDMARIAINTELPADGFEPPREFVAVKHDPDRPEVQRISASLYLIRGPYNVMFSVFPDHVVMFETPMSESYARQCLELVRKTAPDKPIRYAVTSHFHTDHVAGARTLLAEGIAILTTPDAKEVLEKAVRAEHTIRPDALSRAPEKRPVFETVSGERLLEQGDVRARIFDVGPAPHVAQILAVYFPDEKLLHLADLKDVLTDELVIAGVDAVPVRMKLRQLGLAVERFVPVHGMPIDGVLFERAYKLRAKYVR